MTQQHPITPPPDLVQQWSDIALAASGMFEVKMQFATFAAQWGADQELKACCQTLYDRYDSVRHATGFPGSDMSDWLRAARRPKPPSLKEQALALVEQHEDGWRPSPKDWNTIRRALEALPDSIVVFPSQC